MPTARSGALRAEPLRVSGKAACRYRKAAGVRLGPDERKAIAALRHLAKRWPQSLMLFSASGTLCVMPNNGEAGFKGEGRDPEQVIEMIHGIPNDGGDW